VKDPIVQIHNPVLRLVAKPVPLKDISSRKIKALITKMKKALGGENYGVAIAAPQLGSSLRLFVVAGKVFADEDNEDEPKKPTPPERVYINPEITRASRRKKEMAEGCLSVRGQYGRVPRHEKVTLKAVDEEGKPILEHASGLLAQIFQHEVDHLEGILFIDKATHQEDWEEFKKREENFE
jgi:peptide deformylase